MYSALRMVNACLRLYDFHEGSKDNLPLAPRLLPLLDLTTKTKITQITLSGHEITAHKAGTIVELPITEGAAIQAGAPIATIRSASEKD